MCLLTACSGESTLNKTQSKQEQQTQTGSIIPTRPNPSNGSNTKAEARPQVDRETNTALSPTQQIDQATQTEDTPEKECNPVSSLPLIQKDETADETPEIKESCAPSCLQTAMSWLQGKAEKVQKAGSCLHSRWPIANPENHIEQVENLEPAINKTLCQLSSFNEYWADLISWYETESAKYGAEIALKNTQSLFRNVLGAQNEVLSRLDQLLEEAKQPGLKTKHYPAIHQILFDAGVIESILDSLVMDEAAELAKADRLLTYGEDISGLIWDYLKNNSNIIEPSEWEFDGKGFNAPSPTHSTHSDYSFVTAHAE